MNFECHITFPASDSMIARTTAGQRGFEGWKYSVIEGDPLLGPGVHAYLTRHSINYITLFTGMKALVGALTQNGVGVIREKIELIMYDTKTGEGGAR